MSSLWNLPGLDKDTFYAAALYLHAYRGEIESNQWRRTPQTPGITRDFLDRLADCFAPTKLPDARDHVAATAMVRDDQRKSITVYVTKNQSEKGFEPFKSQKAFDEPESSNRGFAKSLQDWFNVLTSMPATATSNDLDDKGVFHTMCKVNWPRLNYYVERICEYDIDLLDADAMAHLDEDNQAGWKHARTFVENHCRKLRDSPQSEDDWLAKLIACARSAGELLDKCVFKSLRYEVETTDKSGKLKKVGKVVLWIGYLGRLYATHLKFREYCTLPVQRGYRFEIKILPSPQLDKDWSGSDYSRKIASWTGDLGLMSERPVQLNSKGDVKDMNVQDIINEVVEKNGTEARVHCEMQLLMYFLDSGEKCFDYFGCSKKSCWLCWQMIQENGKCSMKGTHRKIYPRWAFPYPFSKEQASVAKGLIGAYNKMLSAVNGKVVSGEDIDTSETMPQTSARLSPSLHRAQLAGAGSRLYGRNPVSCKGMFPNGKIEALYLPLNDEDGGPRFLDVEVYEWTIDQQMNSRFFVYPHRYAGRDIALAFELITQSLFSEPESRLADDELGQMIWLRTAFHGHVEGIQQRFLMFYQPAQTPNPYVLRSWQNRNAGQYTDFPYGGDVFIVRQPTRAEDPDIDSLPYPLAKHIGFNDHSAMLHELEGWLKGQTSEWLARSASSGYRRIQMSRNPEFLLPAPKLMK
jgi:hypothetical protein